jgi:hypothetical protein
MYASNPPGNWQHFTKRQDNVGLSLMEVRSKYLKEQLMYEEFISHTMQQQRLQAQQHSAGGKKKTVAILQTTDFIEFVANTTEGTAFYINGVASAPTGYTVTWGDGVEESGTFDSEWGIDHDYPDSDTSYTCRLTFTDPSVITELDFPGFD